MCRWKSVNKRELKWFKCDELPDVCCSHKFNGLLCVCVCLQHRTRAKERRSSNSWCLHCNCEIDCTRGSWAVAIFGMHNIIWLLRLPLWFVYCDWFVRWFCIAVDVRECAYSHSGLLFESLLRVFGPLDGISSAYYCLFYDQENNQC